ncbi:hypothetical protein PG999_014729 [Apiospora kogelbergensis]|uniref:Gfo/Idh/MocA-like oxidoreductase N-terminal domain-containing protein n=1 Tax=Apiospora kogelbergensis TaxID=1337665 RepID=A0AAW0Q2Q8_9PEZI
MAPIRVGLIGLSKTGWAPIAHLPYLKATDKFEIVAVQNSSVESARDAIKLHSLSESTKAYGSSEDLANDPNVDLVVCSTRVDRHKACIVPSLKAGKDVYVEWPLGKSLADAEEISSFKKQGLAIVGLQGREAPIIATVKDFISSGKLGDVISSTWTGYGGMGGDVAQEEYAYFADKSVGGLCSPSTADMRWTGFRKPIAAPSSNLPRRMAPSFPTNILRRTMTPSSSMARWPPPSLCSSQCTEDPPFKGTPALDWRILGSKGELRVTASGVFLQIGYPDQKIEFFDASADQVTEVSVQTDKWDETLPQPAGNVARVYELIAGDAEGKKSLCSFEDAIERHRFLESLEG